MIYLTHLTNNLENSDEQVTKEHFYLMYGKYPL